MAERKTVLKKTVPLIMAMAGGNEAFLRCAYNGLADVSFSRIYPHQNLKELLAEAASAWLARSSPDSSFRDFVQTQKYAGSLYPTIREINRREIDSCIFSGSMPVKLSHKNVYAWLNSLESIPPELAESYIIFNQIDPHSQGLEERLAKLPDADIKEVLDSLQQPPIVSLFSSEISLRDTYPPDIRRVSISGRGIPDWPGTRQKRALIFADKIARELEAYPFVYAPGLESPIVQLELF